MNRRKFTLTLVFAVLLSAVITSMIFCWASLEIPVIMTVSGCIFMLVLLAVVWVSAAMHIRASGSNTDLRK